MKKALLALSFISFSAVAASSESESFFKTQRTQLTERLERRDLEALTLAALDALIGHAVDLLRAEGQATEAHELRRDWDEHKSALSSLELGDHAPLSPWLALRYDWLEQRLGSRLLESSGLSDLKIFNFAIPVAHDPGNPAWDRDEYRRHFVPYAGASTYWVAFGACSSSSLPSSVCKPGAKVLRSLIQNSVAPEISDRVFDRNRHSVSSAF